MCVEYHKGLTLANNLSWRFPVLAAFEELQAECCSRRKLFRNAEAQGFALADHGAKEADWEDRQQDDREEGDSRKGRRAHRGLQELKRVQDPRAEGKTARERERPKFVAFAKHH